VSSKVDPKHIPKHVAIIMDGNRRWAKQQGKPPEAGHFAGAKTLDSIVRAAANLGIEVLTVYAFSTENWKRSKEEVDLLMHLFFTNLKSKKEAMIKEGVRFETIGDLKRLPENVQKMIKETKRATEKCDRIKLILAINYGGRDEIVRAINEMMKENKRVTVENFGKYLDTKKWCDPDLLIRTSGEYRLSNFLIWQACYSEIVVTDVLWPDFTPKDLHAAVATYQKRQRRFGG
jgi:undecaprenyl diphosphate synthase